MSELFNRWVSADIRTEIEQRFYAKISEQADFNLLARNPEFMAAPQKHVGFFADHGVVHARDVAGHVLDLLKICQGLLIPQRDAQRFTFMQGYGVLLAYFHDIGMVDFSPFGRRMHPEFAAQAVFDPDLDDLIDAIWRKNSGGLAWELRNMADEGFTTQEPKMILREMLSLSICHSKSKIPLALLNDPPLLREKLLKVITTDLQTLFDSEQKRLGRLDRVQSGDQEGQGYSNPKIGRFSHLFPDKSFYWLIDPHPAWQAVVEDVIDTCRILRAADALRQRGTVLATSAGYQIFVDQVHGSAIYAFRLGEKKIYHLEIADPISAGEANLAGSELEPSGDLRLSFHHGRFTAPGAKDHAAYSAALVIHDIQQDVIGSFQRSAPIPGLKRESEMLIYLEETEDELSFPQKVHQELHKLDPQVAQRVMITPSLKNVAPQERERYMSASSIHWSPQEVADLLDRMSQTGYPAERFDRDRAFENVRLITLNAGETLIEAYAPSSFVYLPLAPGLKIIPLGGQQSFSAQPWMFLGLAGVVRGAERSATIIVERKLQLLIIPKSTYLTYWHQTLLLPEFQRAIEHAVAGNSIQTSSLSLLEQNLLLEQVSIFKSLDRQTLTSLSPKIKQVHFTAGELVFEQGSLGHSMFIVAKGQLQTHEGTHKLTQFGPGDVFGEMAALTPEPRTASVTALTDSILLRLDQEDLLALIKNNAQVGLGIIEVLAGYVRSTTAYNIALKKQLANKSSESPED